MNNRSLCFGTDFKVRAEPENDKKYIEGYFVVYNKEVEIFNGYFEQISPQALTESIKNNDIRCLFNHDTGFVFGRTGNKTVRLKSDDYGLFASVEINQNDRQAMDIYERVKRGDITTCSFGFFERASEIKTSANNDEVHLTVTDADVFEISVCPFPAYKDTEISARTAIVNANARNRLTEHKSVLRKRLESLHHA